MKTESLVRGGRHCCICHRFRGTKIECHHIIEEAAGGTNTIDNCIPVCFDCHADMTSYDKLHPRGTKYRPEELRRHRDEWFAKVAQGGGVAILPEHRAADVEVFARFRESVPWEAVKYVVDHDFGGEFNGERVDCLYSYDAQGDDPSWEFLDAQLEAARGEFRAKLAVFTERLATLTFGTTGPGRWYRISTDWDEDAQARAAWELNRLSRELEASYRALVSEARQRLGLREEMDAMPQQV